MISFPYISKGDLSSLRIGEEHPFAKAVELMNPLVEEYRFLRTSVVTGLLKALVNNRKHGNRGVKAFESARNFYRIDPSETQVSGFGII